jgi:hypothetical protein
LKFPHTVDLDKVVFLEGREPDLAVPFTEGERSQEIPAPVRCVAVHLDAGIEDVVL